MKLCIKTLIRCACWYAMLATSAAHAHYLWIESTGSDTRLYYGEADVLLKEKSPGKLDNIKMPQAFVLDSTGTGTKANAIAVNRTTEYFSIASGNTAPAILAIEESLEVRDLTKHGLGFAKSNYYARYGQPAGSIGSGPLVLDIQGLGPDTFTVTYRGQPLKETKLEVIAPNTWTQEHKTDADGMVHINAPWRGQYVIHVLHVDKTSGEFAGKKYEVLRNHFTYTFLKTDGADPGPAVPPQHVME